MLWICVLPQRQYTDILSSRDLLIFLLFCNQLDSPLILMYPAIILLTGLLYKLAMTNSFTDRPYWVDENSLAGTFCSLFPGLRGLSLNCGDMKSVPVIHVLTKCPRKWVFICMLGCPFTFVTFVLSRFWHCNVTFYDVCYWVFLNGIGFCFRITWISIRYMTDFQESMSGHNAIFVKVCCSSDGWTT